MRLMAYGRRRRPYAPFFDRSQQPRRLARQIDAGLPTEAEGLDSGAEAVDPKTLGDLGAADVARLRDHLREGENAVRMGVADDAFADRIAAVLTVDAFARVDDVPLDRGGGEKGLEGGAWLVDVGDGAVAIAVRAGGAAAVGIEARRGRHGEHLTGLRVERHQRPGGGAEVAYGALELVLRNALQRRVDGQFDVCAGVRTRLAHLAHVDLTSHPVAPDDQGLHTTPQLRIEGALHALQALAVDVREAEHLAGQLAVRVDPLARRLAADAWHLHRFERRPRLE